MAAHRSQVEKGSSVKCVNILWKRAASNLTDCVPLFIILQVSQKLNRHKLLCVKRTGRVLWRTPKWIKTQSLTSKNSQFIKYQHLSHKAGYVSYKPATLRSQTGSQRNIAKVRVSQEPDLNNEQNFRRTGRNRNLSVYSTCIHVGLQDMRIHNSTRHYQTLLQRCHASINSLSASHPHNSWYDRSWSLSFLAANSLQLIHNGSMVVLTALGDFPTNSQIHLNVCQKTELGPVKHNLIFHIIWILSPCAFKQTRNAYEGTAWVGLLEATPKGSGKRCLWSLSLPVTACSLRLHNHELPAPSWSLRLSFKS